jgi:3-dehydroquinate synthase
MNWRITGPAGDSLIFLGPLSELLPRCCPEKPALIVADAAAHALHAGAFPAAPVVELPPGEAAKSLDTVRALYEKFLEHNCDRGSPILAIGGGVVCDVAGFAASTWLRGVPCGYIPTTLLAQVDAAIGGKTGVNFHGYKNLIGTFQQPRFVVCDPAFLRTLPPAEFRNGLAEAVKHAAIADAGCFDFLENAADRILALDAGALARLVGDSLAVKTAIVNRDAREAGERRLLNFGHTIGHALEKTRSLPHGEAVALGMLAAARLSTRRGLLPAADAQRLAALLARFGLPTETALPREPLLDAVAKDKKRLHETLHFVLLEKIGRGVVVPLRLEELAALWDDSPPR